VTSDIIAHVTIGLLICGFLLVVNLNQLSVSHGFWDIRSRPWPFGVTRHHLSRDNWTRNVLFPIGKFSMKKLWIDHVPPTVVEILSFKDFAVTTLTIWGHVTSSITWPLDSWYAVSYRWSFETICYISHCCWDVMCHTFIRALWKCIDPHFYPNFRGVPLELDCRCCGSKERRP